MAFQRNRRSRVRLPIHRLAGLLRFTSVIQTYRRSMGILCDTQIRKLIGIEPFEENLKRTGQISFGVSSYGYDIRVGSVFKIFTNVNSTIIDPKHFSETSFVTIDTGETGQDHVVIPPNSFALCETVE